MAKDPKAKAPKTDVCEYLIPVTKGQCINAECTATDGTQCHKIRSTKRMVGAQCWKTPEKVQKSPE